MTAANEIRGMLATQAADEADGDIVLLVQAGSPDRCYVVRLIGHELASLIDDYREGYDHNGDAIAETGATLTTLMATIQGPHKEVKR